MFKISMPTSSEHSIPSTTSLRSVLFLSYTIAFGVSFAICKAAYFIAADLSRHENFLLLWGLAPDLVAGALIALFVFVHPRLARFLMDFSLFYYIANIHYALLYQEFLEVGTQSIEDSPLQLWDSIAGIADWRILLVFPLCLVLYRVIAGRLSRILSEADNFSLSLIFGSYAVTCLVLFFPPGQPLRGAFYKTPFQSLIVSLVEHAQHPEELTVTDRALTFDPHSEFESDSGAPPTYTKVENKRFNVIVIVLESTGEVSRRRPSVQTMPNLGMLAAHGAYWKNFYAPIPLSVKSMFALETGHYPAADFSYETKLRPHFTPACVSRGFKQRGYRTAHITSGYFSYYDARPFLTHCGFDVIHDADDLPLTHKYQLSSWGIDDRATFEFAKRWINESSEPFYLDLYTLLPHHPYKPPKNWKPVFPGKDSQDYYQNSLLFIDQQIGDLVADLKKSGRFNDTVFVIFGDHGEAFGQHSNNYIHSTEIYEENVRVPFVISNPVLFPALQVSDRLGTIPDVLPTLYDMFGMDSSDYDGDGASLFSTPPGRMVFMSTHYSEDILGLRDGPYKFIKFHSAPSELYNLIDDPDEKKNIAEQAPERVQYYTERVLSWARYTKFKLAAYVARGGNGLDLTQFPLVFSSQDFGYLQRDQSIMKQPFKIAGKEYKVSGFGTHANSILVFDISRYPGYRFSSRFGRDDGGKAFPAGKIVGEIWVDGLPVYQTPPVSSRDVPVPVDVMVFGKRLSLVVQKSDDGSISDHADWLEPKLVPTTIKSHSSS